MVTLAFFIVFTFSIISIALIDMFVNHFGFFESLQSLLYLDFGIGKWIIILASLAGLICSVINDFRIFKDGQNNGSKNP